MPELLWRSTKSQEAQRGWHVTMHLTYKSPNPRDDHVPR